MRSMAGWGVVEIARKEAERKKGQGPDPSRALEANPNRGELEDAPRVPVGRTLFGDHAGFSFVPSNTRVLGWIPSEFISLDSGCPGRVSRVSALRRVPHQAVTDRWSGLRLRHEARSTKHEARRCSQLPRSRPVDKLKLVRQLYQRGARAHTPGAP